MKILIDTDIGSDIDDASHSCCCCVSRMSSLLA